MLKIGITGNIGTGKSTVCKIFETLSIPVFYADSESKEILFNDESVRAGLQKLFGEEIFSAGIPDRKKIAAIVFQDRNKLEQLNSLLHPAVITKSEEWFARQSGPGYAIKEAALIYEVAGEKLLDKVIVVSAPEQISIRRIMERDEISEQEVRSRMKNQWPQKLKEDLADFIIRNDDEHLLIPQVLRIHEQLTNLSSEIPHHKKARE